MQSPRVVVRTGVRSPKGYRRIMRKQCNACRLAMAERGTYVEGYVVSKKLPCEEFITPGHY